MKDFQVFIPKFKKLVPVIPNYEDETVEREMHISYSQFSNYAKCPRSWELKYVKKIKEDDQSIHLVFGTAFHETLQYILYVLYKKSVKEALAIDYEELLKANIKKEYIKSIENNIHHTTPGELAEFFIDGIEIIKFIMKKRTAYFSTRNVELVGIEMPIYYEVRKGVYLLGYLDLVFLDKRDNEILIWDIKTSTGGWNKYAKSDKLKSGQLVLYKKYFAKQYDIPEDKIKVEFFIVKRKINEFSEWPQKRVQEFKPAAGKIITKQLMERFDDFISSSFTDDGKHNTDRHYQPMAGPNGWNCKFCPYREREDLCPTGERIYP